MEESNAYILGTDINELHRLGFQHRVWSSEANRAWEIAEFSRGQKILDLGCGPGFTSVELGYIAGNEGKVIAVDKSKAYIDYLKKLNETYSLNIDARCTDFKELELEVESLDGAYTRWALAWVADPLSVVSKVSDALKPGGVFVAQEYFDWSTFQTEPYFPDLNKGIKNILKSFKEQEGDIDVGRELSQMFYECGLEVISTRPLVKYATPEHMNWHWPKTFLHIYMPRLIEYGYMTQDEVQAALDAFDELELFDSACVFCPSMIEVIAVKA
jgi:SAM-dependent methyltransferase